MRDDQRSSRGAGATIATLLRSSQAHAGLERAVSEMSFEDMGRRLEGHAHTAWQLLEHLRLTAEDLVSYCEDESYEAPSWPEGYWPESEAPPSVGAWQASGAALKDRVERMASLVEDESRDPFQPVPAAEDPKHNLVRCALVLLDHDAYHVGQLIALRKALGCW